MEAENMHTGSQVTTGYTDVEARHIVEVLDRKRKLLDNEIARFKAQKEEEYRLFERSLRGLIEKSGRKAHAKTSGVSAGRSEGDRPTPSRTFFKGPSSMQENNSGYQLYRENSRHSELSRSLQEASISGLGTVQKDVRLGVIEDKRTGNLALRQASNHSQGEIRAGTLQKTSMSSLLNSSSGSLQQDSHMQEHRPNTKARQPTHHHHPEDQSFTHKRELEFQGLFTPHFLPLLDSRNYSTEPTNSSLDSHSVGRNHESPVNTPPDYLRRTAPQITPLTSRTSTNPPRSSLPTHTTSITNPPRLSSSIPTRSPPSSSATLHSSLRSPTSKKPRSPKRVHFQIDNVVVPPSSTPPPKAHPSPIVYAMPWPTKETSPPREDDPAANTSKLGVADAKEEAVGKEGERQNTAAAASTSPSTPAEPAKEANPAPATGPATALNAATTTRADDDDDDDDGDDLFLLDEEIAAREDDEPVRVKERDDDAKSIASVSSSSSMKMGSPNASSLPIDIKYPVYVDPRDE